MMRNRIGPVLLLAVLCGVVLAGEDRDARVEEFLSRAKVVSMEEIGTGITRPQRIYLEQDGETMKAAFKTVNLHYTRRTRFSDGAQKLNFTDNFAYERAAYLIDRMLGLRMVPVAVLRTIDGKQGAVIEWVGNAISEAERREQGIAPDDPLRLPHQRDVMKVFDALILNDDRNLGNELIGVDDWKLNLIDHSRAFRLDKKLPAGFDVEPIALPAELYRRLEALDRASLKATVGKLLSGPQIKAMLARRDEILAKVEADRKRYGDALVFHDGPPEESREQP